nr:hypothetical protein [Tanacetum cinerariifolium]
EEFRLALFSNSSMQNLFADRMFESFDIKKNGVIEFDEFEMVVALLSEMDVSVSDEDIEAILDKTILDADLNGDGKIDLEEWKTFISKNPSILKNMTLPLLREITQAFPNFVLNTQVRELEVTV